VLVANRGEIACRVLAALREEGIQGIAVFSDADRRARHVRLAKEAIGIGPAEAKLSYLDIDRIIDAAKRTKADAIHPGYGFLSENARFAEAVERAGIAFLGPRAETLALLGDKRAARDLARKAGVPIVPGWEGDARNVSEAKKAARDLGWPVLVKAVWGGGGKGMSRAHNDRELESSLEAAARLAAAAFGDAGVYLEKWIESPRHVEVQIFGDGNGNVVHLFERECSLQRRHQKVIEESPSPVLSEKTRRALTEAAVAIGKSAGYRSAGTCEFLLADNGSFYFLEVNARIQVEHPVTEMVTGKDLVREQLHLAANGVLSFSQDDVEHQGAAVEARIYAEDPNTGFLPQAGSFVRVDFPRDPWLRVDSGIEAGDEVSVHYDPLLAKVIAWGNDRQEAWRRLARSLDSTVIHGPVTNLQFLRDLLRDEELQSGRYSTRTIEDRILPLRSAAPKSSALFAAAAAIAEKLGAGKTNERNGSGRAPDFKRSRGAGPFITLGRWRHPGLEKPER
jgi:acetyl/propionyl-CoA carboxylase alpha subunit